MTFEAIFSFWIIFEFQNKIYFLVDIIKRPRLAVELIHGCDGCMVTTVTVK